MSTPRRLFAFALLSVAALVAVQPAAAFTAYYAGPGYCGGTSPVADACTGQDTDIPSGATHMTISVGLRQICATAVDCGLSTARVDVQVTGFRPTSYDPAFVYTGTCYFTASDDWCVDGTSTGNWYPGDDFIVAGQITGSPTPAVADWCVGVSFSGGDCPLENPILDGIVETARLQDVLASA